VRPARTLGLLAALAVATAAVPGSGASFVAQTGNVANSVSTKADWVPPAVTLAAPADGLFTNNPRPTLSGAAGTAAGDQGTVTAAVYAGATATGAPQQTLTPAVAAGAWTALPTALPDGTYTAQATQDDAAGNTGRSAAHTFTVDTVAPRGIAVGATNGSGTVGHLDAGDTITFTYSEPIDPASIMAGFTGAAKAVQVRFINSASRDQIAILDGSGAPTINLESGTLVTGGLTTQANYVGGTVTFAGTLTRSADGQSFSIVLGAPTAGAANIRNTAVGAANMTWAVKPGAADRAGNVLAAAASVAEADNDVDF
jgi:hypothetical protein